MSDTRDIIKSTSPTNIRSDETDKSFRSKRTFSAVRRNAPELQISYHNTRYSKKAPRVVSPVSVESQLSSLKSPDVIDNFGSFNFYQKQDQSEVDQLIKELQVKQKENT